MIDHSWTGSERQRQPQRPCSTNGYTPCRRAPRYFISAGSHVQVRRIDTVRNPWRPYVTKRDLSFSSPKYRIGRRDLVFHESGYAIRIQEHLCIQ